jgi:hypothetical protein
MRPFQRRDENFDEAQKQDQSGILAQNFWSRKKVGLEFSRELLLMDSIARAVKYRAGKCRAECAVWKEGKS